MARTKNLRTEPKRALDTDPPKRRGPHRQIEPTTVLGRAENNRWILNQIWDSIWPSLSVAQNPEDVVRSLENGKPYDRDLVPWAAQILEVLQEKRFPKRRQARINFLADSIAGIPNVSLRRSRDICVEERARGKDAQHIIRFEFYIECSCGRKGRSIDHACPKCGAKIQFPAEWGSVFP